MQLKRILALTASLMLVASTPAQLPTRSYPDITTSSAAQAVAFTGYKSTIENYLTQDGLDIQNLQKFVAAPMTGLLDRMTAAEAAIAAIPSGGSTPPPTIPCATIAPSGYKLRLLLPWINGTTDKAFTIVKGSGSSTGIKLVFSPGARYDYFVCVPAIGNYFLSVNTSIGAMNTGLYALHLEGSTGNTGSVQMTTQSVGGNWAIDKGAQPISLAAGPQVLTLVVDSIGTAQFVGDYVELAKQ